MPQDCNALDLRKDCKVFSKDTCEWTRKTAGRKGDEEKKSNTKAKTKSICLVLDINQYDLIRKKAIDETSKTGKTITLSMLIRESLRKSYPFLEQQDMFGEEKLG